MQPTPRTTAITKPELARRVANEMGLAVEIKPNPNDKHPWKHLCILPKGCESSVRAEFYRRMRQYNLQGVA